MRKNTWSKFFNIQLVLSMLAVLVLSILPLPDLFEAFRPAWVMLFILYLQFYLPAYFNMLIIILFGLSLDVLLYAPLGENILAITITTLAISNRARRFHFFTIGQQMLWIFALITVYILVTTTVNIMLGHGYSWLAVFGVPCASMLFWPGIRVIGFNNLEPKLAPKT